MHRITLLHISIVRTDQITLDHLDRMKCERIGKVTICSGNICFDCMGHCIHSGMCDQFLWHGLCKFGIYDCNVRCDLKVSNRIFDTLFIISDD